MTDARVQSLEETPDLNSLRRFRHVLCTSTEHCTVFYGTGNGRMMDGGDQPMVWQRV